MHRSVDLVELISSPHVWTGKWWKAVNGLKLIAAILLVSAAALGAEWLILCGCAIRKRNVLSKRPPTDEEKQE